VVQSVFATHAVDALPSLSQVPVAHGTLGAVPPAQYVPAVQFAQVGGLVAVAAAVCVVPAAQLPCAVQVVWFAALV
jgi:hypothetical protein